MTNWNLADKRIYKLLKHPNEIDKSIIDDLTSAYYEFIEELFSYINSEKDNKKLIRTLNTNYIDFETLKSLEELSPTEHSKPKIVLLDKLMSLINMETELVYRQMENPKFFSNIDTAWKSPFYLNEDVVKPVDLMEIVTGLFNMKKAVYRDDRKDVFFSDFVHEFGKLFNVDFGDVYKKELSVIKRKPSKITEFLDRLKASVIQRSKDEGYYNP